jgi:hypothetical protein
MTVEWRSTSTHSMGAAPSATALPRWGAGQAVAVTLCPTLADYVPASVHVLPLVLAAWQSVLQQALVNPPCLQPAVVSSVVVAAPPYPEGITVALARHMPLAWQRPTIVACADTYPRADAPQRLKQALLWLGEAPHGEGSDAFWQGVLLHELGHALGLPHTRAAQAVMAPGDAGQRSQRLVLTPADVVLVRRYQAQGS